MDEKTLAYIAGIIDGEGCITILEYGAKQRRNWRLTVSVVNTSEWLVQWLMLQGFGKVYEIGKTKREKRIWQWRVDGRKAGEFLTLILPYLMIKKSQADVALRFQHRRTATLWQRRTDENIVLDEAESILIHSYK